MNFGDALKELKAGGLVRREDWQQPGKFLFLAQREYVQIVWDDPPTELAPFIVCGDNEYAPWVPSQADILADDWKVCPPGFLSKVK